MKLLNVVGPKIRKIRSQLGWSQEELALRLQYKGLEISRSGLAKIETQLRHVSDTDLVYFARALGVPLVELYPLMNSSGSFHETIQDLLRLRPHPKPVAQTCSATGAATMAKPGTLQLTRT